MPRGDKSKYTAKQDRKASHIADGYEARGISHEEAERRAWATVSGRGRKESHASSRTAAATRERRAASAYGVTTPPLPGSTFP